MATPEASKTREAIGAALLESLTEMVGYDKQRGGVSEVEPQEEWVLWWESHPDGKESRETLYGNLGQVVIEWIDRSFADLSNNANALAPYSVEQADYLRMVAQAYSDWVEDE